MAILTKAQLEALNQASFPDNSTEAITPAILRTYNTSTIDTLVDSLDTGSFVQDLTSLNAFTQSQDTKNSTLATYTASVDTKFTAVGVSTASLNAFTSSTDTKFATIGTQSGSWGGGGSTDTGSLMVTGSVIGNVLTFTKGDASTFTLTVATGSGGGGSTDTGSLLVTASFNDTTRNITFTKGDASTFNLGGFATTGSNNFVGEQQITSSLNGITMLGYSNRLNFGNSSFNDRAWLNLAEGDGGNNGTALQFTGVNTGVSFNTGDSATPGVGVTPIRFENTSRSGSIQFANSGNSNLIQITNATGSVSITTPGEITLQGAIKVTQKGGGNNVTIVNSTGSLLFSPGAYTTASLHLSQSSGTATTSVNFVFKTNNNTADTIISGSNNIFTNPAAPTAGFKRYVGSSANTILNANSIPQVSASMAFPVTMNNNIWGSAGIQMRGPVSSSTWTISTNFGNATQHSIGTADATPANQIVSGLTLSNNFGGGFASITGYKTPLSASVTYSNNLHVLAPVALNCDSSSITYSGNISSGPTTINNSYLPGTINSTSGVIGVNGNNIFGTTIINASGSNTTFTGAPRGANNNVIGGYSTIGLVLNGDNSSLNSTAVIGGGLVVTGSNSRTAGATANADFGSAFFGRWNDVNGNRAISGPTVFAVGTGTSTSLRKTGFLIDSGSNTFIEGTLNVSGSTTFTGSISIAPTFEAKFATGSNQQAGTAVLDGGNPGTVTVSNSLVTTNSIIMLTKQTLTNSHMVAVSSKGAGTFTITSNGNGDTDTVGWFIINNS